MTTENLDNNESPKRDMHGFPWGRTNRHDLLRKQSDGSGRIKEEREEEWKGGAARLT